MKERRRLVFIFASFLFLLYGTSYAQSAMVNLNYKDASFVEVINEFRTQTGVRFMYNLEKVKDTRCKDLVIEDIPVEDAIGIVLGHFGFTYSMIDGVVVVRERQDTPRVLRGVVIDDAGHPIPGVTVMIKGTTRGTVTDMNGNFNIASPSGGDVLVFSFLGKRTREVTPRSEEPLRITLETDTAQLDEVVVVETGYGTILRKDMVGSYTIIKADDIMMPGYTSIDQMLQGWVPGMVVQNTSSRVGRTPDITIRGTSTLLGNSQPLWVVDGIIQSDPLSIDVSSSITNDMKELVGNQISWLNPADIETITVLRDASATAVYGAKASNGVIVITTKKGRAEKTGVRYSGNMSIRVRPNYGMFNHMNSLERIQFGKEAYDAGVRYQFDPLPQIYTYEGLMSLYNQRLISEEQFMEQMQFLEINNTDWYKLLTRTSVSHSHNLSFSGGTEKISYNASLGYSSNRGTEKGDDMDQFTARLNLNMQMAKNLRVNFSFSGTMGDTKGYGGGVNPQSYANDMSRAVPAYDQNGERVFLGEYYKYAYNRRDVSPGLLGFYNIEHEMENGYSSNKSQNFNVSMNLDWRIIDWLSYQFVGGVANRINRLEAFASEKSAYITRNYRGYEYGTEEPNSEKFNAAMLPFGGELNNSSTNSTSYNLQNKLVFSKTVNDYHRFNAMLAMEIRSDLNKNSSNTVWGFVPDRGEIIVKPALPSQITVIGGAAPIEWGALDGMFSGAWRNRTVTTNYMSFFATFAYSFRDKYVFNGNIRSDASNRFGQDTNKQFDPTFSFGASWKVAKERFMENVRFIDELNLRATWGVQGNVINSLSPELIATQRGVLTGYNEYYVEISSLPNPHLKWERTYTWNFGLDVQMFEGIQASVEYYGRRSNAIVDQDVAQEYGRTTLKLNGGLIHNHGIEFSMNVTPVRTKDFVWTLGLNSSRNWNKSQADDIMVKADKISKSDYLNNSKRLLKKGYPLSGFWSYSFAGLNPENGYPMFNYLDFEEADENIDPLTFLVYSGQREPFFTGGFNTRVRYKNFSMGTSFSVLLGEKKRMTNPYGNFASMGRLPDSYSNLSRDLLKRWQKPGDEKHTIIPALYTSVENLWDIALPDGTIGKLYDMWANSDTMVVNASFLRCTQISLSYNLSQNICRKIGATSLSLNASVSNPFVIASKRFNGFDPELQTSILPRIISCGLSLGF